MVKADAFGAGHRRLYRQVETQIRPFLAGVFQNTHIRQYQCINTVNGCLVNRIFPAFETFGPGEGIDGDKNLSVPVVGIADRLLKVAVRKIQPGKMPCIGLVLEPDIDSIGAVVDGRFQRGQITGRANKFHGSSGQTRVFLFYGPGS